VIVVGAGAVGLCCSIALARRGARVTLIERGLAGGANSTLTGGGIRQQFGTEPNVALSLLSAPFWTTFAARFGVDPYFEPIGYLFIAHDEARAATLRANVALQNRLGVDSVFLDGETVAERWPTLRGRGVVGAAFRQGDGWANQHRIVDGLTRGAIAAGVDVRVGVEVLALETSGGVIAGVGTTAGRTAADAVVLATGPWTQLLRPLGLAVPVVGYRHELLIVEAAEPLPRSLPWLISMRDEVHVRPDVPGRALVGGFLGRNDPALPDRFHPRAEAGWTRQVLEAAGRTFGVVDGRATVRCGWAGLYPCSPDGHPIIDSLAGGLYAALGFSGTGLMHAPAAGDLVAELVLDGELKSLGGQALSMGRFGKAPTARENSGF